MKTVCKSICVLFFCVNSFSYSQKNKPAKHTWEFDMIPYGWFASIKGKIATNSVINPVEAKFDDVLDQLSFGGRFHAEAREKYWILMTDITYAKLEEEGILNIEQMAQNVDSRMDQLIIELGGGYNFVTIRDWLILDGLFGARYHDIGNKLIVPTGTVLDRNSVFTDPYLGLRFRTLSNQWINRMRFDLGGFGLGSEISWKFNIVVGYKFSELISLYLGYEGYDLEYKDKDFELDIYTGGIGFGMNFHF